MSEQREWSKLDNAAKIFPSNSSKKDTKVFRAYCKLKQPIRPDLLQKALDQTLEGFPFYRSVLKKGFFWHYFETTEHKALVREEYKSPCKSLYNPEENTLLFEVTWYRCRINLEVFHSLTDGTGAMQFLKTLVLHYLQQCYPDVDFPAELEDYTASVNQKKMDSFAKYYAEQTTPGNNGSKKPKKAYQIKGQRRPNYTMGIVEARLSVADILKIAHDYQVTLTELLVSFFILSIHDGMSRLEEKKPVVLSVPVDLRRLFPAYTARNFFGLINIVYDFKTSPAEFDSVVEQVRKQFQENLTVSTLQERINTMMAFEFNPAVRGVPLILKNIVLRQVGNMAAKETSSTFSNVGKVSMPKSAQEYIELFGVYTSARRPQICMSSYQDVLCINFSNPFQNNEIACSFIRRLTNLGLGVEIVSTDDRKEFSV